MLLLQYYVSTHQVMLKHPPLPTANMQLDHESAFRNQGFQCASMAVYAYSYNQNEYDISIFQDKIRYPSFDNSTWKAIVRVYLAKELSLYLLVHTDL